MFGDCCRKMTVAVRNGSVFFAPMGFFSVTMNGIAALPSCKFCPFCGLDQTESPITLTDEELATLPNDPELHHDLVSRGKVTINQIRKLNGDGLAPEDGAEPVGQTGGIFTMGFMSAWDNVPAGTGILARTSRRMGGHKIGDIWVSQRRVFRVTDKRETADGLEFEVEALDMEGTL